MSEPIAVVIVPTFKRPAMLRKTLATIAAQATDYPFAVVVVENDAARLEGQDVAFDVFARNRMNGVAIVEPKQGNVEAINAGYAAALERYPSARYFLMIDDDEIASPRWLDLMVGAAKRSGAGIVGGPVAPQFEEALSHGMQSHPVFWPISAPTGPLPMIYGSGNCLVRRDVFNLLGLPAFDVTFNFLGGGDTDFFTRARNAGVSFYWQADALINEMVPASRTRAHWVFKRGLRIGAINRRIERKSRPQRTVLLKDAAVLLLSPFRFVRELIRSRSLLQAVHPVSIALGRLLSIGGVETSQYRAGR